MPLVTDCSYLRWVGGKRRLVTKLAEFLPSDVRERTYHEPFVGAASLFLSVRPKKAVLSDLNEDLISSYEEVRENPALVARYLRHHAHRNSEQYYYRIREQYNLAGSYSAAQAARFIYLNRTCFNGIFRVNTKGQFNVPYGRLTRPLFPDTSHLQIVSEALDAASLQIADFSSILNRAKPGEFVYFDPPYPPLNGTSYFRHYTSGRFDESDQEKLAKVVQELAARGCLVMMSNADTELIRSLYRSFEIAELSVNRPVTCKKEKRRVSELVIRNYSVER
ncbi:MAG: Dam family site-specific DNA-(adenine-N6)-methyltransferase [Thermoanaerobaculia bacterium]|nr:Dam family site-specific DNA-(adenine-N6)-methyltransferase [Thermoanaerobaculia bacterium]